jgi:hypothetical protein
VGVTSVKKIVSLATTFFASLPEDLRNAITTTWLKQSNDLPTATDGQKPPGACIQDYCSSHSPELKTLLAGPTHTKQRYTVWAHNKRIFEKLATHGMGELCFLSREEIGSAYAFLAIAVTLHDIGKPRAHSYLQATYGANYAADQQRLNTTITEHTVTIAQSFLDSIEIGKDAQKVIISLIDHDILGQASTGKLSADTAVQTFRAKAEEVELPYPFFLALQTALFVSDAGSYPFLEEKFFTTSTGRVQTQPTSEYWYEFSRKAGVCAYPFLDQQGGRA